MRFFLSFFSILFISLSGLALPCTQTAVLFETTKGNIKIEMYADKSPVGVTNFLRYVNEGFYDGTIFHRVIPQFVVQGGGLLPDMSEKSTYDPIVNEAKNGLSNLRGTIAYARTSVIDSATSQFYFNLVDNQRLDYKDDTKYGYSVFGKIGEGLDVIDAMASVVTGTVGDYEDVPVESIFLSKAFEVCM